MGHVRDDATLAICVHPFQLTLQKPYLRLSAQRSLKNYAKQGIDQHYHLHPP